MRWSGGIGDTSDWAGFCCGDKQMYIYCKSRWDGLAACWRGGRRGWVDARREGGGWGGVDRKHTRWPGPGHFPSLFLSLSPLLQRAGTTLFQSALPARGVQTDAILF